VKNQAAPPEPFYYCCYYTYSFGEAYNEKYQEAGFIKVKYSEALQYCQHKYCQ